MLYRKLYVTGVCIQVFEHGGTKLPLHSSYSETVQVLQYSNKTITSKLETPQLESNKAVAHLNDMHKCIEIIRCNDETVALQHAAPAAKQQVTTQTVLQRTCQVLVEYRVEVVVVSARVVVEL